MTGSAFREEALVDVFVDTSAVYAALDADDANSAVATPAMDRLLLGVDTGTHRAVTHSGVVHETVALVQRRLGLRATRVVIDHLLPVMDVVWIDGDLHDRASTALLAADRRNVRLVDWTSFLVMRDRAIDVAFAFDDHFLEQGFERFEV